MIALFLVIVFAICAAFGVIKVAQSIAADSQRMAEARRARKLGKAGKP